MTATPPAEHVAGSGLAKPGVAARGSLAPSRPLRAPAGGPIWPHAVLGVLLLAVGVLGCAPKDVYWTRAGASEKQFRAASRRCGERAILALSEERGESCSFNSGAGGSICTRPNPSDPIQVEAEKKRQKRRLSFLYGECLEAGGWIPNTQGNGHKGRY